MHLILSNCCNMVGMATGYRLDNRGAGIQVLVGSRICTSPYHPDWPWGPASFLFSEYQGLFPQGRDVKLTTHHQLVPRSRKHGSKHPLLHTSSWHSAWLVNHRQNFSFYSNNCFCTILGKCASFHK
jgi:hypothetical protein